MRQNDKNMTKQLEKLTDSQWDTVSGIFSKRSENFLRDTAYNKNFADAVKKKGFKYEK